MKHDILGTEQNIDCDILNPAGIWFKAQFEY